MRVKTLGLAFLMLLAFGAVSAAGASAYSWKWEGAELAGPHSFTAKGTVEIEEQSSKSRYSCSFNQEGTVGPGAAGEITGKKVYTCTNINTPAWCESAIELEALHLPWKTELVSVNGVVRDRIANSGAGTPEWKVKCNGLHGKTENVCSGAETTTGMANASNGVYATFDEESATGSCSIGTTLVLRGSENVQPVGGGELTTGAPQWLFNGKYSKEAGSVAAKGSLKIADAEGAGGSPLVAECTSAGKGSAGPGNGGTLSTLTLSACKYSWNGNKTVCESASRVEALHLPWRTALIASEGTTRELFSEDGKGAPGFKIVCKTTIITAEDTCTGKTSASVKNVTGGVDETFDSHSEKLSCSLGKTGSGTVEGTSLVEDLGGETLSFKAA
jgi:hypothetical protein